MAPGICFVLVVYKGGCFYAHLLLGGIQRDSRRDRCPGSCCCLNTLFPILFFVEPQSRGYFGEIVLRRASRPSASASSHSCQGSGCCRKVYCCQILSVAPMRHKQIGIGVLRQAEGGWYPVSLRLAFSRQGSLPWDISGCHPIFQVRWKLP